VTITTGASHSILWNLESIDTTLLAVDDSLVPAFYDGATLADSTLITTFDPTVLGARSSALADRSGVLGAVVAGRLDARGADICPVGGGGADLLRGDFGGCAAEPETAVWAAGFYRSIDYDGSAATLDHTNEVYGGAGGFDWVNGDGLTFGAMAGYGLETMDASSRWATSYDNEAKGFFGGAYGRQEFGTVKVDLAVAGGQLDHDDDRFVNDNLAYDATGFYDGAD
jgi:hypothetical protein